MPLNNIFYDLIKNNDRVIVQGIIGDLPLTDKNKDDPSSSFYLIDLMKIDTPINPFVGFTLRERHLRIDRQYVTNIERHLTPFHYSEYYKNISEEENIVVHIYITRQGELLVNNISVKKKFLNIEIPNSYIRNLVENSQPAYKIVNRFVEEVEQRITTINEEIRQLEEKLSSCSKKILLSSNLAQKMSYFEQHRPLLASFCEAVERKNLLCCDEFKDGSANLATKLWGKIGELLSPQESSMDTDKLLDDITGNIESEDEVLVEKLTKQKDTTLKEKILTLKDKILAQEKIIIDIQALNTHDCISELSNAIQKKLEIRDELWLLQFETTRDNLSGIEQLLQQIKKLDQEMLDIAYAGNIDLFKSLFPYAKQTITPDFILKIFSKIADLSFMELTIQLEEQVIDEQIRRNIIRICDFLYENSQEYRIIIRWFNLQASLEILDKHTVITSFIMQVAMYDNFDLFITLLNHGASCNSFGGSVYGCQFNIPAMLVFFTTDPRYMKVIMQQCNPSLVTSTSHKAKFVEIKTFAEHKSPFINLLRKMEGKKKSSKPSYNKGQRACNTDAKFFEILSNLCGSKGSLERRKYYEDLSGKSLADACVKVRNYNFLLEIIPHLSICEKINLLSSLKDSDLLNTRIVFDSNVAGVSLVEDVAGVSLVDCLDSCEELDDKYYTPENIFFHMVIYPNKSSSNVKLTNDLVKAIDTLLVSLRKDDVLDATAFQETINNVIATCITERLSRMKPLATIQVCLRQLVALMYKTTFTSCEFAKALNLQLSLSENYMLAANNPELIKNRFFMKHICNYIQFGLYLLPKLQEGYKKKEGLSFIIDYCQRYKKILDRLTYEMHDDNSIFQEARTIDILAEVSKEINTTLSMTQQKLQAIENKKAPVKQGQVSSSTAQSSLGDSDESGNTPSSLPPASNIKLRAQ